jgi:hydroxymethylpyrimidine/phosphomethylpyrimidine kinase
MTAIAVTIAGSDSGGGAGIQADLKTFSALNVYGASILTAITAQNTQGVTAIHDVPPHIIAAQIDAVFSDLAVNAVKIGMLSVPVAIAAVAVGLERWKQTLVVLDPVMVATSGDRLLAPAAIEILKRELIPRALIITPNLHEAAALTDTPLATNDDEMRAQAHALLGIGANAVLIKGGHAQSAEATDLLVTRDAVARLTAEKIDTKNTHGTGCTLSAGIAAGLAKGLRLAEAVAEAKHYVTQAIGAADELKIGHGHGPVHHFHAWW